MAIKKRKTAVKKAAPKRLKVPATKKRKAPVMDHDAMMAAWLKAASPAEGHRRLEPLVGAFRSKTTFVMEPGGPPQVSDGSSENRWVLGGRYLEQLYKGTSMGMPFEGIGYTGFDNVQRKYVGCWMDCFGTGLMNSVGVGKPTSKLMEFEATAFEPSGKLRKFWCKVKVRDRDRNSYEIWAKAPSGEKFRMMLCEYTRA